ncbi:spiralin lipoprotein [Spiroplasma phoeniceum]|uniref:Spiralin n=2 Tax=Spiroplasma phoeniceum TaxID=47835 RepID=A0A345DQW0_9MOLU|nr:spiralin lipoprotein [Spiroplasma phoeniceum]AAB05466.1 spiralin [Spiroplasma phoeniceum P40]AXF96601.1 spiralin [Spiroplasma phoeniceum P40]
MKRLLSILAVFGVSAVGTTSVIACNKTESNNLSRVTTIAAPETVDAIDAAKVTKEEIKNGLNPNVLKAVQGVVKTAQATDFVYEVYADNQGKALDTVNLKAGNVDVYVQITPAKDKTVVIGKSGYIKVTLPKAKADISDVTVPEKTVGIKVGNPQAVTKNELEAVNKDADLAQAVLNAIKAKVSDVEASEFAITNNGEVGDYSAPKTVEVTVKANDSSAKITGQFKFNAKVTATTAQ